ncbi:NAD-binding protein [Thermaerobacter subterraneus]|uniref:NAD-binding protein n=1 Tax=Thermaerobacter subterraneus TaxID=175696 RepID=UPI0001EB610D|nr:NAD-binding protein [Thermaerobacter subterraneus]
MLAGLLQVAAEGLVLAERLGVDRQAFLDLLESGPAAAPLLKMKLPSWRNGDFPPQFQLALMHKDLGLALAAAHEARVPLPATAQVAQTYAAATAGGLGHLDFSAILREVERRGGGPGGESGERAGGGLKVSVPVGAWGALCCG